MAPYSFHGTARIELDEAADYYDAEHRGLGLLFIDAANRAVTQMREFRNHVGLSAIAIG